jgi:hypothetical protein
MSEAVTAIRAPLGQNGVVAGAEGGGGAAWLGAGWAEAELVAKAAAPAMPSAVSTSRRELIVHSFRLLNLSIGDLSIEDLHIRGPPPAIGAAARY